MPARCMRRAAQEVLIISYKIAYHTVYYNLIRVMIESNMTYYIILYYTIVFIDGVVRATNCLGTSTKVFQVSVMYVGV